MDGSLCGYNNTKHHSKDGGFPGPVGAKQTNYFIGIDFQRRPFHHFSSTVFFFQLVTGELIFQLLLKFRP
jgi:hypothetical protein